MNPKALDEDRYDYARGELTEASAGDDPMLLFTRWLEDAQGSGIIEPKGCCLSTATTNGIPSARFLLLRGHDDRGFFFFSNYDSRKGDELAENPRAAMTFWWAALERQIRIEGATEPLPEAESDEYWARRPKESRYASAASPQSRVIDCREELDARVDRLHERFPDEMPRPANWGGILIRPRSIEFWQGRPSRMHDRLLFTRADEGWRRERLAP